MGSGLGESSRLSGLGPGSALGRYVLKRKLGHGGMGIVFLAHDPLLDRLVALKVLLPEIASNPDAKRRFIKEGRTAVKFKHPNVVTIYDVGEEDGFPFLVMEYLEGETLAARLLREPRNRLTVSETLRVMRPVFDAASTAHASGIIHRDLKPENIFLVGGDAAARPFVLDFGIAKAIDGDQNQTSKTANGQIIGTPRYMAPEQLGGGKDLVGAAADQYALGVIVYECVAGRHPLGGDVPRLSMLDLLGRIAHTLPEPLQIIMPEVGGRFSLALARMLAKSVDQRFDSVREALVALEGGGPDEDPSTRHTAPIPGPFATPAPKDAHAEPSGGRARGRSARVAVWTTLGLATIAGGAVAAWRASRPLPPNEPPAALSVPAEAPRDLPAQATPAAVVPSPAIPAAPDEPPPAAPSVPPSNPSRSVHRSSPVQRRRSPTAQSAPAVATTPARATPSAPPPVVPTAAPAPLPREPEKANVASPDKSPQPVRLRDNGAPVIR